MEKMWSGGTRPKFYYVDPPLIFNLFFYLFPVYEHQHMGLIPTRLAFLIMAHQAPQSLVSYTFLSVCLIITHQALRE